MCVNKRVFCHSKGETAKRATKGEFQIDGMEDAPGTIEKARCALPFATGLFAYGLRISPLTKLEKGRSVTLATLQTTCMESNGCAIRLLFKGNRKSVHFFRSFIKDIRFRYRFGHGLHEIGRKRLRGRSPDLLQDGMSASAAVVGGGRISAAVVVVKNEVFALVPYNIGYTVQIACVLSDDKRSWLIRDDHSGSINIAALIINGPGVLRRSHGDVWRIDATGIGRTVGTSDVDRVVCVAKSISVSAAAGGREKVR